MVRTPAVIARYYDASASGDLDALVACFTPNAHVHDDGRDHHGHAGIRAWREELTSAFTYTLVVTGVERPGGDEYVVSTHLEGDFPGGVVDLENRFRLQDDLVADLVI